MARTAYPSTPQLVVPIVVPLLGREDRGADAQRLSERPLKRPGGSFEAHHAECQVREVRHMRPIRPRWTGPEVGPDGTTKACKPRRALVAIENLTSSGDAPNAEQKAESNG